MDPSQVTVYVGTGEGRGCRALEPADARAMRREIHPSKQGLDPDTASTLSTNTANMAAPDPYDSAL